MKTTPALSLAAAFVLAALSALPTAKAQIQGPPDRIDYQGHVLDNFGAPLAPTTPTNYSMQFRIWNSQTGGTLVWSESQTVTVSNGAFSVRLGEGIRIPSDTIQTSDLSLAFAQKDRYLGLTVTLAGSPAAEITPRLAFLTSPFSFTSAKSVEAESVALLDAAGNRIGATKIRDLFTPSAAPAGSNPTQIAQHQANPANWSINSVNVPSNVAVPVGGVIMWWGAANAIPAGFEICNGGTPTTQGALISSKPDLRDRFVKGKSNSSGNVSSPVVAGGLHTTPDTATFGTALTQSQLPAISVPAGQLTALSAGAHSHRVFQDDNDAVQTDSGDGSITTGGGTRDRNVPTFTTTTDGAHTHQVTGTINSSGSGQTHTHIVPSHDNRPAFVEMFYIIRVK